MQRPYKSLLLILLTVGMAVILAVLLWPNLRSFFFANTIFNGLILAVLAIGVLVNLRQVLALWREVHWLEAFKRSAPDKKPTIAPRLLAPMSKMLKRQHSGEISLSALSSRSLLDGIRMRIDESRDLSRYLTGLLVFLGLLGTFWGLLLTIDSVKDVLAGLEVQGDGAVMFETLRSALQGPLGGMGIAFSSSLFGLAGSLILGFLDLQAGHAQNRFVNDLEDWLSGLTKLSSGHLPLDGETSVPAYVEALLEQTADGLERLQRQMHAQDETQQALKTQFTQLNANLQQLANDHNRRDDTSQMSEELRQEFRLLNRTLANALKSS